MAFDEIGALQRIQIQEQLSAIHSGKLRLRRKDDNFTLWCLGLGILLSLPTLTISLWIGLGLALNHMKGRVYVRNVATGQRCYLSKTDWKTYKANSKRNNSKTVKLSDLSK